MSKSSLLLRSVSSSVFGKILPMCSVTSIQLIIDVSYMKYSMLLLLIVSVRTIDLIYTIYISIIKSMVLAIYANIKF